MPDDHRLQELAAEVAAAYFSNSNVSPADIPFVMQQIASSLAAMKSPPGAQNIEPAGADESASPKRMHGSQVKKSITPDALISFEDGRPYKILRRHLATRGLTPATYREKWGLPADYPMVSPNYSSKRAALARGMGLGQPRRRDEIDPPSPAAPTARRGGRRKSTRAGS